VRRQRVDLCTLLLTTAPLFIILALLHSTDNYLNQKAQAQLTDIIKSSSSPPSAESVYLSITNPDTSKVNYGLGRPTTPSNPANTAETIVGSFLNPKILLSSAIDQIRNSTANNTGNLRSESSRNNMLVVWDYDTVLLSQQTIPPKDFILIFDTLPDDMDGHISTKLPCSANSTTPLKIYAAKINVGQSPQVRSVPLQIVRELSKPGYMCVYHADIPSPTSKETKVNNTNSIISEAKDNLTNTSIELFNPTTFQITLPDTSSAAIGLNQTMPSDRDQLLQPIN
jgi:hypothetical protein